MQKNTLTAQKRTLLGRKVKKLRQDGLLPANVFGKNVSSKAVTVSTKEFLQTFAKAGETGLIDLELEGKKLPVLINNVTYDPVAGFPLHIDFHQVDLKQKVTARVPLEIVGEPPAVKDKLGVLLTNFDEIEVEALPQDLPEKIEVDVSSLKSIDEAVKISDLKISSEVKVLTDPELEIVKIAPLVSKAAEQQAQADAQAAAAAAVTEAAAEPVTGEPKTEAESKPEEAKKQEPVKKE